MPPPRRTFFYVLAQTWTPAMKHHYKQRHGKKAFKNLCSWNFHGLWLNSYTVRKSLVSRHFHDGFVDGRKYQCKEAPKYATPIPDCLFPDCKFALADLVPSLVQGEKPEDFYKKIYNKHGKCIVDETIKGRINPVQGNNRIISQEKYLCTAGHLFKRYDMNKYFPKELEGLFKGRRQTLINKQKRLLNLNEVKQVILNKMGTTVDIIITSIDTNNNNVDVDYKHYDDGLYIDQVLICLDMDFKLINCPSGVDIYEDETSRLEPCEDNSKSADPTKPCSSTEGTECD